MDQYFQQFKNLPRELRMAVSSDDKVRILEEIEKKYNLKLIKLVVRVMIKDISWLEMEKFCQENFNLSAERVGALKKDLTDKIFNEVLGYLHKTEKVEKSKQIQPQEFKQQQAEIGGVKKEEDQETLMVAKQTSNPQPLKPIVKNDIFLPNKAEVDKQKVKEDFNKIKPSLNQNLNQDEVIKKIINQLNLNFNDFNLEKRFINIIKNYFRDIRNELQTEEVLSHSKKTNGLELSADQAALMIKIAQTFKKQNLSNSKKYFVEREAKKEELRLKVEDLGKKEEEKNNQNLSPQYDQELKKRFENGPINPFFQKIAEPIKIKSPQKFNQITGPAVSSNNEKKSGGFSLTVKKLSGNNLVQDVSAGRFKALGPVEELADITLADLQHWGGGVNTTKIVFDKINLLAEISLTKRVEAIRAWQRSPLYLLYLEIGRLAMQRNQSIFQIMEERQKNNLPTINQQDFEAIGELNKKLRF